MMIIFEAIEKGKNNSDFYALKEYYYRSSRFKSTYF